MVTDTQLIKGLLEGCILGLARHDDVYGYRMVEMLGARGFDVNEATVYPILVRLENRGFLSAEMRPSAIGPARKYYRLTSQGRVYLEEFMALWLRTRDVVDRILAEREGEVT